MKVLVATDIHVHNINGKYYLATQLFSIINRYYEEFGMITMYCRMDCNETKEKLVDATSIIDKVIVFDNLMQVIMGSHIEMLESAIRSVDIVVGRFHSFSACRCGEIAKKLKKPFYAEVMGDAWDGYWNHGIAGKLVAPIIFYWTKRIIRNADYALYVTENFLQKRYPCKGQSISASNVVIESTDEKCICNREQQLNTRNKSLIKLMTAANVDIIAKGHEFVIKAIPLIKKEGIDVKYYIAGGGDSHYLKAIADKLNVSNDVVFLGRLTPEKVKESMDNVDIYIQPSLQEGLPRSVIEAMSRACPVIGSDTAGIPELLQNDYIVKRRNYKEIASKVLMYISLDKKAQLDICLRNFNEAPKYELDRLNSRRHLFFQEIRKELRLER